ncbi:MAG: S-layer homology domain-containing protein, partial [Clostridia bacterium]|nr:S-layer homology domain-containing protein [Clostridia bacterium]
MFNKRNRIKICAIVLIAACFLNFFTASAAPNFKRPLDSVYHVAYEKIMQQLYPFKCDKTTLGILSDFYEELVNANIRLDTEFYPAQYANIYATDAKEIVELVVKESENYSGSDTHIASEILTLAKKILPELEISIAKINGYAPGTKVEPGFHNFDFSKPGILFSDVPPDSWYAADVAKVSGSGIMQGTGNNKYEPDKVLTKAEATILFAKLNAIYYGREQELQKFLSNPKGHWASGVLDYCTKYNLPFLRLIEFDPP